MATPENNKPKRAAVVVVRERVRTGPGLLRTIPAALVSVLFHVGLIAAMIMFIPAPSSADSRKPNLEDDSAAADKEKKEKLEEEKNIVQPEKLPPESKEPLVNDEIDPNAEVFNQKINYNNDNIQPISVPGNVNPDEVPGIDGGDKNATPFNISAPPGTGGGQGGYLEGLAPDPNGFNSVGMAGGINPKGMPLAGTFFGRSGATREKSLREGGGTKESEAAVARGLKWLVRQQATDGHWELDGDFPDQGGKNDIAGTAFGLLPLLGAGYTHLKAKNSEDNPFDKPIEKALWFLMGKQDKKTGNFGGGMYAHGLATIAMCEAYGLSQDPALRRSAQMAVNYILYAQHDAGGWRYGPKQAGDMSVAGWQIMALKSAKMAGLMVPEVAFAKAIRFVDSCNDPNSEGYGYVGKGSAITMTAVGLLSRQYLQSWGSQNIRMIKGVNNILMRNQPTGAKNIYYHYYATQVMHHFGGESWTQWNDKMRDYLIKTQDRSTGKLQGSWDSKGSPHTHGRLMYTSLALLTLEVYYRHLPLYYREMGEKQQRLLTDAPASAP